MAKIKVFLHLANTFYSHCFLDSQTKAAE